MDTTQIDYHLLAAFVAVAETTGFSKAAKKLGVTKGTVSRAIARLEDRVGVRLVHRTARAVQLTEEGRRLLVILFGLGVAFQCFDHRGALLEADAQVEAVDGVRRVRGGQWLPGRRLPAQRRPAEQSHAGRR